jgi:16S rRNA processing protein RimM
LPRRPPEKLVELGRVADAYGVRGWIKVEADSGALAACPSWWIGGVERAVEASKAHSGRLLAKLSGIADREQALKLKGKAVSVARDSLPHPGEGRFYTADLVGLEVVNAQGLVLGVVKEMFSNGAHEVMELSGDKRERLLPFVPAVVKRVDLEGRRIEVDWGADW